METDKTSRETEETGLETTLTREQGLERYLVLTMNRYARSFKIMNQMIEEIRILRRWLIIGLSAALLLSAIYNHYDRTKQWKQACNERGLP